MLCRLTVIAVLVAATSPVAAQEKAADDFPGASVLVQPRVVGFVYAPLALYGGVTLLFDPPQTPRLFSPDEGGGTSSGDTVPELDVAIGGAALAAALFTTQREGRWYHLEGMAEALSMTLGIGGVAKNFFGRHRPHYVPGSTEPDLRESFPSAHSAVTFSLATYGCLFLHRDGELGWVRTPVCAALLTTAGLVAYSRVADNRHHPSDVIAGGALGTAVSIAFFAWQEHRYRHALEGGSGSQTTLVPGPGLGLGWAGTF